MSIFSETMILIAASKFAQRAVLLQLGTFWLRRVRLSWFGLNFDLFFFLFTWGRETFWEGIEVSRGEGGERKKENSPLPLGVLNVHSVEDDVSRGEGGGL